ncbi:MAG: GNAT family N-acetyltransferase [Faecousia sp.]
MYETNRLLLKHPEFSDWEGMYRNLWRHQESAKYMLWNVTTSEEEAQERMRRSIAFQEGKPAWFVYEKRCGEPIGFAGFREIEPRVFEDTGIAVGPAFVGKGYGKEILNLLTRIAKEEYGAVRFIASCRSQNSASRGMILGCGFRFDHQEDRIDQRDGTPYVLEFYVKNP